MSATPGTVLLRYWPMKLLLAALAVTFAIAVVASVFAIWPVVADAPWEDEVPTPVVQDQGEVLLCEAAIRLRDEMRVEDGKVRFSSGRMLQREINTLLGEAKADIDRYC